MRQAMFEDNQGSSDRELSTADRVLEDSREVDLIVRKKVVGTLCGIAEPQIFESGGLSWRRYCGWDLTWTNTSAIILLQGGTVQLILEDFFVLLGGEHRPVFHPTPGIDSVTIAEIWTNVEGLSPREIFDRILTHRA